jgi:hypothetical protein
MLDVRYCGTDGDLVAALREAADFVATLSAWNVFGVIVSKDDTDGWTVAVIYRPK